MKKLGELDLFTGKPVKSVSERMSILIDILNEYDRSNNKKKQTIRNLNFFAAHIKTKDLYVLLSMMKQSKNPAGLFWSYAKPKN